MKKTLYFALVFCMCFTASACTQEFDKHSSCEPAQTSENFARSNVAQSTATKESTPEESPYEALYLSQFHTFTIGQTTQEEVRKTVGEPHDYWGFGYIRDVYFTEDGHNVSLTYQADGKDWVLESMEVDLLPNDVDCCEPKTTLTAEEALSAIAQAEAEVGDLAIKNATNLTQEQYLAHLGEITNRAYMLLSERMKDGFCGDFSQHTALMNTNVFDGANYIISCEDQETTGEMLFFAFFHPSKDSDTAEITLYQFREGSVALLQDGAFTQFYPTEQQLEIWNSLPTEAELAAQKNVTE